MNEITEAVKKEITTTANDLLAAVNRMQVRSEVENNAMVLMVGQAKKGEKVVKEKLEPTKTAAKKTYDAIRDLEKSFLAMFTQAKEIGLAKSTQWLIAEQEKREALQRKLDAEREAKEKAEAERVAKLQAKAEEKGKVSVAVEKVIPQIIVPKVTAPSGVSYVDAWSAEITDIKALCKEIVEGRVSINTVLPNMPVLNNLARINKCESTIKGVKFVKRQIIKNY